MFIRPMLLEEIAKPFENDSWITELKFDGIRLLYSQFSGTKLFSRSTRDWTASFPEIIIPDLPDGTLLDGEVIVPNTEGKPDFERLLRRMHSNKSDIEVMYCVFDILYYKWQNIMTYPLIERKAILNRLIKKNRENIFVVPFIFGNAIKYFDSVKTADLEGIVQKKKDSIYVPGRRVKSWLKIINYKYEIVQIVAIRKNKYGLLVAYLNNIHAGTIEFLSNCHKRELQQKINVKKETEGFLWIEPVLCRVKYRNKTSTGKLRLPMLDQLTSHI